ncbi:MAG: LLM class flavin-dependent oxidoreductase [Candidatus Rokuibacteriota bacterium]|nr:MAG: LLM class flavin-dependent oxidoreductase [Candidatus Rokubacteria bacterium]
MKFGYFTLADNSPGYGARRRDPNQFLREVAEECVEAERMGFASAWVPEHHFGRFGILPSPAMFLTHVAARTRTLKLGPATVVLPLNHPLRTVEEFNLLDLLSDGRAVFSAGRGYDAGEYGPFGASFKDSRDVFDEQMEYMMAAWRKSPFEFHGTYYSTPEPLTVLPHPVQKPHPDVYVACFSKPSIELAARLRVNTIFAPFAAAMLYGSVEAAAQESKKLARDAGLVDQKVMCSYFVSVAHSDAEADRARERLLYYLHNVIPVLPQDRSTTPPHIAYFVDIVERLRAAKPGQLGDRSIVTGDAEHCIEVLKKCEAGGLSEVICYFNFGLLDHRETLRAMERFAREVMRHFEG